MNSLKRYLSRSPPNTEPLRAAIEAVRKELTDLNTEFTKNGTRNIYEYESRLVPLRDEMRRQSIKINGHNPLHCAVGDALAHNTLIFKRINAAMGAEEPRLDLKKV